MVINATGMEPLGGIVRPGLRVEMYVEAAPGAKPAEHLFLVSLDHNALLKLQPLTGIVPGVTVLELRKIRKGWIGTGSTIKDELLNVVTQFLEPTLKNSYSTQLLYTVPDLEIETWELTNKTRTLMKKLSPKLRKKLGPLLQRQKQNFQFSIKIAADHVMEEVEIGRIPQLLYLLSRIGGYMSLLSLKLHFFFVKRYPDSKAVQTYEAKTLLWSDDAPEGPPDNHTKADPREMETA
ncbi:KIF3A [Symbiodinium sp. CCMP2456]|nr:KIF3A [Symbiodinium sp. CCMP2456]